MLWAQLATIAGLVSAVLTAAMTVLAPRWRLVDAPDGHRKLQKRPMPLGGGLAIAGTCVIGLLVLGLAPTGIREQLIAEWRFVAGFFAAAGLMVSVGLLDDLYDLRGRHKLLAQVMACGLVAGSGLSVERLSLFGWTCNLGPLALIVTFLWLVGAINAFNLIDGLDGLAGTVATIIAASIGIIAILNGRMIEAAVCAILVGSVVGFLVWNWHPARIYLGDAGSMLLGLVLGVLALRVSVVDGRTVAGIIPTAIWAMLFFDVVIALLRRRLTGQSIYVTDRAHIHHVLRRHGYSVPAVVAMIGSATAVCCLGAITAVAAGSDWVACLVVALVLAAFVSTGLFGQSEVSLWSQWARRFLASWLRPSHRAANGPEPLVSRFHGDRSWEHLWAELLEYSERFDLSSVQLNVSAPAIGEEYHALWSRKDAGNPRTLWRSEIPLFVGDLTVGRLMVCGRFAPGTSIDSMSELVNGLKPFQVQMEAIIRQTSDVHIDGPAERSRIVRTDYRSSRPHDHLSAADDAGLRVAMMQHQTPVR